MKEVVDPITGVILFKHDEGDPTDKRIQILENKVDDLTREIAILKDMISSIKGESSL